MQPHLLFKALGYVVIGLLSFTLLVLSLISAAKEHRSDERLKGLLFFTLAVIGLCTIVGLLAGYVQTGTIK